MVSGSDGVGQGWFSWLERWARLQSQEKARAQELQRSGEWRHLWRVAGRYANVSIFDVDSTDRLHELLSCLPLFPYLDIRVTALATTPRT